LIYEFESSQGEIRGTVDDDIEKKKGGMKWVPYI